ncbi:T9SS type A sorting domain-containing protein [Ulvibacter antarcticus]|uniref:Putative secreted protein (Por secretion system target) n=1 Tax=Ulvibacter antarcticus TaxID=442714 RepID=A0A3L9Z111_9FLAO|nr:T9SS type A sorting domain-containing protein [Ulvibacter antarcticus]RMA65707.1 putative secreted protein (Por secretion system target) [Ulvibacter antarcticus]
MKYIIIVFFVLSSSINAQIVNIPDAEFKTKLLDHSPIIDTNSDSEIQLAEAEAFTGTIEVNGTVANPGNIADLTGIEAFVNIVGLNCSWNQLTNLNLSTNSSLEVLRCDRNSLTTINLSGNLQLRDLNTSDNLLETLGLSGNDNLESISCSTNSLVTLDLSNKTNLTTVDCQSNELISLNLGNSPNLEFLISPFNHLTTLDVSDNVNLRNLNCANNTISNIDLSNNIELLGLNIRNNDLLVLSLYENVNLRTLDCRENLNLADINLRNGNNLNFDTSGSSSSNFESLPTLETVCLDDINSNLAGFIETHVGRELIFTDDCNLSLNENELGNIFLFPNPLKDTLQITSDKPIVDIKIYDLQGQLLYQFVKNGLTFNLDMSTLSTGIYFVHLTNESNRISVEKIIKSS